MLNRLGPRGILAAGGALLSLVLGKRRKGGALRRAAVGAALGFGVATVAPGLAHNVAGAIGSVTGGGASPQPVGVLAQVKG